MAALDLEPETREIQPLGGRQGAGALHLSDQMDRLGLEEMGALVRPHQFLGLRLLMPEVEAGQEELLELADQGVVQQQAHQQRLLPELLIQAVEVVAVGIRPDRVRQAAQVS